MSERSTTGGVTNERGFTLVELLVAITILGIIMVAIGAMITTAFRTTTIVSNRLEASRAPKLVSTYWVPDVESAEHVLVGGGTGDCAAPAGSGLKVLVTFTWTKFASQTATDAPTPDTGISESATWWSRTSGPRSQVVRTACHAGVVVATALVVPDVGSSGVKFTPTASDEDHYSIKVFVPDRNEADKEFDFTVDGTRAVLPPPVRQS